MKSVINQIIVYTFLFTSTCFSQWQNQNSPVTDGLHDVFFLNDSLGWAYSYGTGILINTLNGGNDWHIQSTFDSLYFEQIQFVDENNGWLCGEYGYVFKTTDGGNHWADISPEISNRILTKIDLSKKEKPEGWYVSYYTLHFFNEYDGFIAGQKNNLNTQERKLITFATSDGGNNWNVINNFPPDFLFRPFFLDKLYGFVGGMKGIYKTIDGSINWENTTPEIIEAKEQIRDIYFGDKEIGWACGFSGYVYKTIDGGNNWEKTRVTKNRLRSIVFLNNNHGFVVGDANIETGVLFETTDCGATWNDVELNCTDLHRIYKVKNRVWTVGKEGTILTNTF